MLIISKETIEEIVRAHAIEQAQINNEESAETFKKEVESLKCYIKELEDTLKYENVIQIFNRTNLENLVKILELSFWREEDLNVLNKATLYSLGLNVKESPHFCVFHSHSKDEGNFNIKRDLIKYILKKQW